MFNLFHVLIFQAQNIVAGENVTHVAVKVLRPGANDAGRTDFERVR